MKYLSGLFSILFLAGNVFASDLCDSTCRLSITFPDGGSIKAVEPLTMTFGYGGFINDGAVTTGYSLGDTLSLDAMESIDFQDNGEFELGYGGNMKTSNLEIVSNGVMKMAALRGKKKIKIREIRLYGAASLNMSSDFEVDDSGSFHVVGGLSETTTELVFTNEKSVKAYVELDNAESTLEEETDDDISGLVLVDSNSHLTMTSEKVVLETIPATGGTGGGIGGGVGADGTDVSVVSSGADLFSYLSLLSVFVLLVSVRLKRFSDMYKPVSDLTANVRRVQTCL